MTNCTWHTINRITSNIKVTCCWRKKKRRKKKKVPIKNSSKNSSKWKIRKRMRKREIIKKKINLSYEYHRHHHPLMCWQIHLLLLPSWSDHPSFLVHLGSSFVTGLVRHLLYKNHSEAYDTCSLWRKEEEKKRINEKKCKIDPTTKKKRTCSSKNYVAKK